MPVIFDSSEERYPAADASLEDAVRAFVAAVRETRIVTNETIHRWADAFDQALPKTSDQPKRW